MPDQRDYAQFFTRRPLTRRDVFRTAAAAGAAGALGVAGIQPARATTEWDLPSPMAGTVTRGWHSNAIDIVKSGAGSVYAYFRRGSAAYGYIEPVYSDDSCETPYSGNEDNQLLFFYLRTDGLQSYVGSAIAQHIYDISVSAGNLYSCPRYICAQGPGDTYVSDTCFTGSHVHYWANGSAYGNPSGTVYGDSPIFWTWNV
ncbi:MAG: hypothetical protein AMXMBFR7_53140 [Planctomycetota bacterium]